MVKSMKISTTDTIKRYSDLMKIENFFDRFEYLKLRGQVGVETFGSHRYLNQILYRNLDWKRFRRQIIIRDDGFELGHLDVPISGPIYVHHLNPITIDDVLLRRSCVFDPDNAISVSFKMHQAIHYGYECPLETDPVNRTKNDTCPWRK